MKRFITIVALVGFVSISLFGFLAMSHSEGHETCLGRTVQASICPETGTFSAITFHFSVLRGFSTAVFDVGILATVILAALFLYIRALVFLRGGSTAAPPSIFRSQYIIVPVFLAMRGFVRGLALNERSPSFA